MAHINSTTRPDNDRLMSVDELADYLQIPKATLYRWRSDGNAPRGMRLGKYLRFRRSEVDAWLESKGDRPCAGS